VHFVQVVSIALVGDVAVMTKFIANVSPNVSSVVVMEVIIITLSFVLAYKF